MNPASRLNVLGIDAVKQGWHFGQQLISNMTK